jgi:SAM-dependent methyltransferase
MRLRSFFHDLASYYRGCHNRDLQEFYNLESGLPYFDHVSRILGAHKRRILLRWLSMERVGGPILELGSGIGTFARQLGRRGYQVVAVDISPAKTRKARLRTAQQRHPMRVHHVAGDLRQLGRDSSLDHDIQHLCQWPQFRPFEVILAADVLEHVPETPLQTVQHIRALLASQGRVLTSVPSRLCRHDPGHFWTLLPAEWEAVFTAAGFRIHRQHMSRLCWFGLPTPLPLAMVYELRLSSPVADVASRPGGVFAVRSTSAAHDTTAAPGRA